MSKRPRTRTAPVGWTSDIERWAGTLTGIDVADVRRTSNRSKKDFSGMMERAASSRPDDPDVQRLASYGPEIVLPEGREARESLGAFTITRGSVDGSGSRAVLGWAIPIGSTLFVLYLQSARAFDIAGASPDQGMNAFAEALRSLIRGARPAEVHTPLLSRVFRLVDHAVPVMRTLRTCHARLYAEGRPVPLDGDDDRFMATIQAAISDKDAAATVARLEGDRLSIYGRGEWYLSRTILPFTWDTEHKLVQDPHSGALVRVEVDRHVVIPSPRGRELLQTFVRLGGTPGVGRDAIAIALGKLGVVSRAPSIAGQMVTLDKLRNPRNGVDSLCTRAWVAAFRTGVYQTEVEFTSDLRSSYPNAPLRVDDEGRRWLAVTVQMPAAEGGWQITDAEWDAFEQQQFEVPGGRLRRGGRSQAASGRLRPLLGLCQYVDADVQHVVLGFESSGYQLCQRPAALAVEQGGAPRAWGAEAQWVATVNSGGWHASLAKALLEFGVLLADRLAPLTQHMPVSAGVSRQARLDQAAADALVAVERVEQRITGIRSERQEVRGDTGLSTTERDIEITQLKADEAEARTQLIAARALLTLREAERDRDDTEDVATSTSLVGGDEDADFSSLELVIAALLRHRGTAPAALASLIKTLLGDSLRWQLADHGTTVSWQATVRLPLRDGTTATHPIAGQATTSTGTSRSHLSLPGSERQKRLPRRSSEVEVPLTDRYARRYFLDGHTLVDIADSRAIKAERGSAGPVYRALRDWLLAHGVVSEELARAALDLPILAARQALYTALTGDGTHPLTPFQAYLRDVYRDGIPTTGVDGQLARQTSWGVLWCAAPMLAERRVTQVLLDQPVPGAMMNAALVADLADIPYTTSGPHRAVGQGVSLIDMTNGGRRRRAQGETRPALPLFLTKDWAARDSRPGSAKQVGLRRCTHRACNGFLLPVPVPEVAGMLLCNVCRRLPGNDRVVFPPDYLQPWTGGRRRDRDDGVQVGTVLAPNAPAQRSTPAAA